MSSNKIILGRIGDAFGIHGWVHVYSFTDPAENLFQFKNWFIRAYQKRDAQWRPVEIESHKTHGDAFIVKLKGCDDRDQALLLKNHTIAAERAELPALPTNQYYWSDLTGLTVINTQGVNLGTIDHLFETGANDVIVTTQNIYIPYLKSVVISVDIAKKEMIVEWEPIN